MKHEAATLRTKKALGEALKRLMGEKPLSKISVSEIVADAGVNRKTFYYHFPDIYALLKWVLEQEAIEVVKGFDFLAAPEDAIAFVIDYVNSNKHILCCAYDSMGREEMKRFFDADLHGVMQSIVERLYAELSLPADSEFRDFLTDFYAEALVGMLINYFKDQQRLPRDALIRNTVFILKHSILSILKAKKESLL